MSARDVMQETLMSARICRRACCEIASCDCAQDVVKQLAALDAAGYAVVPKNQTAAFLADNVSDEMVDAFFNERHKHGNTRQAISAALRAAAGSATPEVK